MENEMVLAIVCAVYNSKEGNEKLRIVTGGGHQCNVNRWLENRPGVCDQCDELFKQMALNALEQVKKRMLREQVDDEGESVSEVANVVSSSFSLRDGMSATRIVEETDKDVLVECLMRDIHVGNVLAPDITDVAVVLSAHPSSSSSV